MTRKSLEDAEPRAVFPDLRGRLVGQHFLIRAGLEELSDPEAAGIACCLLGRQRVIGADHLVAIGDVGARAQEQRAVVFHVGEEIIGIAGHHLYVLGGDAVGLVHHLLLAVADDHLAEIRPGLAGRIRGRKDLQQPLHPGHGVARELLRIGQQHGRRGRAMLGLAEQVGRTDLAVDAVVGDDQCLGRPGEQVDADAAEQLALGFRHIGIAGADDHVDCADRLGAERHGGYSLHPAQHIDVVGAAEMHGGDDGGMRPALERRCAGSDALHAGDARRHDRHVRGRYHRIASARHVAADRVHRDVRVAEDHAGQGLDLEVAHGLLLLLREVAHLRLRELDVVEVALGDLAYGTLDFRWRELESRRRPAVELLRQLTHGGIAPCLDIGKNAFHRLAHLGVGGLDRARVHSALEDAGHEDSPIVTQS